MLTVVVANSSGNSCTSRNIKYNMSKFLLPLLTNPEGQSTYRPSLHMIN